MRQSLWDRRLGGGGETSAPSGGVRTASDPRGAPVAASTTSAGSRQRGVTTRWRPSPANATDQTWPSATRRRDAARPSATYRTVTVPSPSAHATREPSGDVAAAMSEPEAS